MKEVWWLKVLNIITYPIYSHFLEYNVSGPFFAGLLITYDILIKRPAKKGLEKLYSKERKKKKKHVSRMDML